MYDIIKTQEETTRFLDQSPTLADYVDRLERLRIALGEQVTKSWPVHHVDPPTTGAALLYAEDGWDGTYSKVLRLALEDAFDSPELLTLVVWTRNDDPATRNPNAYIKTVGQAGDDVLGTSDGNEVVRFYDGRVIDLDDVVAVSF